MASNFTKVKTNTNTNNIIELKDKEIAMLKDELNKSKILIAQLNGKIQELQTQLTFANNNYSNKIKELENNIILKNNELKDLKVKLQNITSNQGEKQNKDRDKCVNFLSSDHKIYFAIPCSGTSTFAEVEELLYREYPEYRETNNIFLANGKEILRFKTINENNVGSGRPVMLTVP